MSDRYCVFGNPIAHSRSPAIHAAFARQSAQDISYEARLAPLDGFAAALAAFVAEGGRGANVTVPFKEEACRLATRLSPRAQAAAAVNTLAFDGNEIFGDNTDGAGLVADISGNLAYSIAGRQLLLVGAGGAARGVILPLLAQQPAALTIANRRPERAQALSEHFADPRLRACALADLDGMAFDLVINATSAGLSNAAPALPEGLFAAQGLAYDMVYGKALTPFLQFAQRQGAGRLADGLGMLVEQAAEAFALWRGLRPDTAPVLAALRA